MSKATPKFARRLISGFKILALAFAFGCLNCVLDFVFNLGDVSEEFLLPLAGGFLGGQVVIPWLWCGFSRSPLLWRLTIFMIAVALLLMPLEAFPGSLQAYFEAFELWLPVVLAAYVPIAVYRFVGRWELTYLEAAPIGDSRQVSIAEMAIVTFITALTFATQIHYQDSRDPNLMFSGFAQLVMWVLAIATFVVCTLALTLLFPLMTRPSARRIGISCGILVTAIVVGFSFIDFTTTPWTEAFGALVRFLLPLLLMLIATLSGLRRAGFRLVKSDKQHP